MSKKIIIPIMAAVIIVVGTIILFSGGGDTDSDSNKKLSDNISVVNGKQIITIDAKGGYFPRITNAKSGLPTVIKMQTKGTFDCSSALKIPSLNYRKNLPPSGETLIDVPAQSAGTNLRGLCSMGMFNFNINFN